MKTYKLPVELLPDGAIVDYSSLPDFRRSAAEDTFEKMYEDLAGTALSSKPIADEPYCLLYEHVASTVYGIPVPITATQAEAIKHAKFAHGDEVDVLSIDGGHFILSKSGSRRVLANVRARYVIAKRLNCTALVQSGSVRWVGTFEFKCDE